jgi:hypothetical protein
MKSVSKKLKLTTLMLATACIGLVLVCPHWREAIGANGYGYGYGYGYIDIKPSSCPNPINTKSRGVLPVAVLGTEELDVTTIDPATVALGRESVDCYVLPLRWSYEDVATPFEGDLCDCHELHGDGYLDLTLKFNNQELVECLALGDVTGETVPLILTGDMKEEFNGTRIEGSDCVWILEKNDK